MIKVQKLEKPSKRSGFALAPGAKTTVRGLVIVNTNSFVVYVDKFTSRKSKKKVKK